MKIHSPLYWCIVALALGYILASPATAGTKDTNEWRSLFNGENLDGWEFRGKMDESAPTFDVENGAIVGRTRMPVNPTAFVGTTEQFKDFELIFEVKIDKDLNSGVQVRSTSEGPVRGAQVEIQNGFGRAQARRSRYRNNPTTQRSGDFRTAMQTFRAPGAGHPRRH